MTVAARTWRTCDLKSASFLIYAGFEVMNIGKENARVFFEFAETDERKVKLLSFWNKAEKVEPTAFLDCLNKARDMVTQTLKS